MTDAWMSGVSTYVKFLEKIASFILLDIFPYPSLIHWNGIPYVVTRFISSCIVVGIKQWLAKADMVSGFRLSGVQLNEGIRLWVNAFINEEREVWVVAFYFEKVVEIDV